MSRSATCATLDGWLRDCADDPEDAELKNVYLIAISGYAEDETSNWRNRPVLTNTASSRVI